VRWRAPTPSQTARFCVLTLLRPCVQVLRFHMGDYDLAERECTEFMRYALRTRASITPVNDRFRLCRCCACVYCALCAVRSTAQFNQSSEGIAADALIDSWGQGKKDALDKAVKLQTFEFLPNAVAVIARKLVFDEAKLATAQAQRQARDAADAKKQEEDANKNLPKNAAGQLDLT
jgi:hypothetical protein